MRLTNLLIVFIFTGLLVACGGKTLQHDNPDKPIIVPATPTPYPYKKGIVEVEKLINKTFAKCKNDKGRDLTYAFTQGKYLLEIQDLVYNDAPWSTVLGLSPVEISSDKTWESTAWFRAEVTGQYDIYAHKWLYREGKPNKIDFKIQRLEGRFICEGCEQFESIPCSDVQKILDETPRYQNNE